MATLTKQPLRDDKDDFWDYLLIQEGALVVNGSGGVPKYSAAAGQAGSGGSAAVATVGTPPSVGVSSAPPAIGAGASLPGTEAVDLDDIDD